MKPKPCIKIAFGIDYLIGQDMFDVITLNTKAPLQEGLLELSACPRARLWVLKTGVKTLKEAWNICPRGDWMAWLVCALFNEVSIVPAQWFARTLILLQREGQISDSQVHWANRLLDHIEAGSTDLTQFDLSGWSYTHDPDSYTDVAQFRVMQIALGIRECSTKYMWQAFQHDDDGFDVTESKAAKDIVRVFADKLRATVPFERVEELWNK